MFRTAAFSDKPYRFPIAEQSLRRVPLLGRLRCASATTRWCAHLEMPVWSEPVTAAIVRPLSAAMLRTSASTATVVYP